MNIEQIIRDNIKDLLHLSLATCVNNHPWVCEVHFAYDDELNLYFRSKKSRRHSQEIAVNPYVSGNIVRTHGLKDEPVGIYFEGKVKLLEDDASKKEALAVMIQRNIAGEDALEESHNPDKHQFYKINVKTWYAFGKFDGESNKKYELSWNK